MKLKKSNRVITIIVTSLFVLSFGWFAVLPPTSAWFYQKYDGEDKQFIFGTLSLVPTYQGSETLDLIAATKLEDPNETLFNEVLHIVEVEAQNNGTLPARVYLTVDEDAGNSPGLRYFFYENEDSGLNVKQKVINKGIVTDNDALATYTALDIYNTGTGVDNDFGRYIVIQPGITKTLNIAFWADYNQVGEGLEDTDNVTVHDYYDVQITLSAGQDTEGWFTR